MGEIRENICLILVSVVFAVFVQLRSCVAAVEGRDTLSLNNSISGNKTIVSKNGTFELGFFNPNGTNNWYVGIWYANLTEKTYVWVANRESPAKNSAGVLNLSEGGDLGLFDATGASLWSVNVTKKVSQAVILDSGNFVMFGDANKSEMVWQSFDYPTDTWLPGMRFGGQQKILSWKNSFDPAPGLFSFHVDSNQFVLTWNNSKQYWASGTWDGKVFSQVPEMSSKKVSFNLSVEDTESGLYGTYTFMYIKKGLSRLVLHKSGGLQLFLLPDDVTTWNTLWSQPRDQCTVYGLCGAYGSCNSNNIQFCSCVDGFAPKDKGSWESRESWAGGCVRENPLNCNPQNGSTDGFTEPSVTLPDAESASSYPATTKKDCEKACLLNCSCTAFAFSPPSGPCQIWSGDLLNMHKTEPKSTSVVSIRVSASAPTYSSSEQKDTSIVGAVLGIVGALIVVFGIVSISLWQRYRHRQSHRPESLPRSSDPSNSFLRMYSYMELKIATRNFRSKLGSGGFGTVYKGHLIDGTLVAVKKMKGYGQDEKQFRAEISSLGNIQHVNLIRLRGFCARGSRRFLIYDYMPNGSLNSLIFNSNSEGKQKVLDWKTRFQIALGTARGLAYLHEECRYRIIHSDVKPENILLDNNFSPKLADFGLAKLVGRDFSRVLTTTRGTRGYLAPEWISGLPITSKVDVYSFGITLLEIISGRRSLDFNVQDSNQYYFPAWAATEIYNGNTINVVEEGIAPRGSDIEDVRRAIIVGLLCIEKDEEVRPSMGQVVLMLEGKMQPQILQIQSFVVMDGNAVESDSDSDDYAIS